MRLGWRSLLALLAAFGVWVMVGQFLFPVYAAKLVLPTTSAILGWIGPEGVEDLRIADEFPYLSWHYMLDGQQQMGRISFILFVYNSVLYLTLATALPGLTLKGRLLFGISAAPVMFLFHLADLSLAIEGRLLSAVAPQHTDFLEDFSLWYSFVKVYNHMSIMAIKQIVFGGLFYLQWILADGPQGFPLSGLRKAARSG